MMEEEKEFEEFKLEPSENKGTGFFGKWAYYAQKKREWLEEQKKKKKE
jgi:hypothetical protein